MGTAGSAPHAHAAAQPCVGFWTAPLSLCHPLIFQIPLSGRPVFCRAPRKFVPPRRAVVQTGRMWYNRQYKNRYALLLFKPQGRPRNARFGAAGRPPEKQGGIPSQSRYCHSQIAGRLEGTSPRAMGKGTCSMEFPAGGAGARGRPRRAAPFFTGRFAAPFCLRKGARLFL